MDTKVEQSWDDQSTSAGNLLVKFLRKLTTSNQLSDHVQHLWRCRFLMKPPTRLIKINRRN